MLENHSTMYIKSSPEWFFSYSYIHKYVYICTHTHTHTHTHTYIYIYVCLCVCANINTTQKNIKLWFQEVPYFKFHTVRTIIIGKSDWKQITEQKKRIGIKGRHINKFHLTLYTHTHTHTHTHTYIYIYIYILFTNLISTSIHGTSKKRKKKTPGTRDKNISNHNSGEKEKIIGQKERKAQPRETPWKKSRDTQSVGQKKTKTFRESCNATITRVLKTSGANYKINLNRESGIFY